MKAKHIFIPFLAFLAFWVISFYALAKPPEGLSVAYEFSKLSPPGNVAITPDGRTFMSLHGFYGPEYRVVELNKDGSTKPFPNKRWSRAPGPEGIGLNHVLGIRADARGILWILDNAGEGHSAKLLGWDTTDNNLHKVIYIDAPFIPDNGFLNDLAIDLVHNAIFITDTTGIVDGRNNDALIVVDLGTGEVRRVLEGHISNLAENVDIKPDGKVIKVDSKPVRVGSDSITLDTSSQWLYFGPMSGRSLYRIRTTDLLDRSLAATVLAEKVERYSDKPVSDGLTIDINNNIYVTDVNASAIGVIRPDRSYQILYQDKHFLSWPDGFSFGPNSEIYVTVNQLHRSPVLKSEGSQSAKPPFYLMRFKALAAGTVGR